MENAVRAGLAAPDELGTRRLRRERRVQGPLMGTILSTRGRAAGAEESSPRAPPRRGQDLARAGGREGGTRWAAVHLCSWKVVVLQPLILEVFNQ